MMPALPSTSKSDDISDPDTEGLTSGSTSTGNARQHYRSIRVTLSMDEYDAEAIRAEFRRYQPFLPRPDKLLQQKTSPELLRETIAANNGHMPRFLKAHMDGGIAPHDALCCLLLDDLERLKSSNKKESLGDRFCSCLVSILSFGCLYPQNNVPADIIREQFNRVAHAVPTQLVSPDVLRVRIRDHCLPIPNYFLDPENEKQFPPHIALLVILQDGEKESRHLEHPLSRLIWSVFSIWALVLRLVLEVIGGAGAIWGGSEVFGFRDAETKEMWRWLSIAIGVLCFLRFVTLNAPLQEDAGDILGPAGIWSLPPASRLRAVTSNPFHFFVRAQAPYKPPRRDD